MSTIGRSMSFGAGNGVTTLGFCASSGWLTIWWIKNNTIKKARMPNPRRSLRLTSKIPMKLWSLLLFFRILFLRFAWRRGLRSLSTSAVDLFLLRPILRALPAIFSGEGGLSKAHCKWGLTQKRTRRLDVDARKNGEDWLIKSKA